MIFGSNQLRKKRRNRTETLTLAVRGTYLTSMAGSTIVEDDALRSPVCRLWSPPKGTVVRRLDSGALTLG
jgi:hypothetical protein